MTDTQVQGTRDEIIDNLSTELSSRLLSQVLEPGFKAKYMAVGEALLGSNPTMAMAVTCQVLIACGDMLKRIVQIEPAPGEAMTSDDIEALKTDIVMEAASRTISETLAVMPEGALRSVETIAEDIAKEKGREAFLRVVGGKDLAPKPDETKH